MAPKEAGAGEKVESASDALARRIGGVFIVLLGVASFQIAGVLVMQSGGLGFGDLLDLGWIARAGASSQFTRWGAAHLGFPLGVLLIVTGLVYVLRKRRA